MLEVLTAIFNVLTAWCPRFTKIPPTHRLVKWVKCEGGTVHGPGLIWYWPLVSETEEADVRWVPSVTEVQSITMADGASVSARVVIIWKVIDVLTAVESNSDYSDRATDIAQAVVLDVLGSATSEHLKTQGALAFAVGMEVRQALGKIGLGVDEVKFTELVISPAVRVIRNDS